MNLPITQFPVTDVTYYLAIKNKKSENYYMLAEKRNTIYNNSRTPENIVKYNKSIFTLTNFEINNDVTEEIINMLSNENSLQGLVFFRFEPHPLKSYSLIKPNDEFQAYVFDNLKLKDKDSYLEVEGCSSNVKGRVIVLKSNEISLLHISESEYSYSSSSIKIKKA